MESQIYDVIVIGGGPVGMFASFYAGLHELKTLLVESLPQLGGQVAALYPEKPIWDVAGAPGITGKELVQQLQQQLSLVDTDTALGQHVNQVKKDGDHFVVQTKDHQYAGRSIVIALGNGAFKPRPLALPGAADLSRQQLAYFVRRRDDYRNKTVAVLGGGNSAMDTALMLADVAKQVYLIHRRDSFRGLPATEQRLRESTVELVTPYLPKSIASSSDQQVLLDLKKMRADGDRQLQVDTVVVNYGFTADHASLAKWPLNIQLDDHQLIEVDDQLQTATPGVYAIGDGVTYPGKLPLMATGFGEGPTAINAIASRLYPDKRMATHSSSMHLGK